MNKQQFRRLKQSLLWLFCMVIFATTTIPAFSQQMSKVEGVVKDTQGEPLIGVTVASGATTGTITDIDGRYTINVSSDGQLKFSMVGMNEVVEKVGNRTIINVVLSENSVLLGDVVVTALGIKREEKALGYAVQKVDGKILETVKGVNIATSLSGKIAGVMVKNSTTFGADPEFLVRGEKPLLVLDGVPTDNVELKDIPADDVENISVLKGATASALYGERGQNGAIMVTTKKGQEGQKLLVSVNSSTMISAGHLAIPKAQSVFGRGTTGVYNRTADRVWGQVMDGSMLEQWNPKTKELEVMPYLPVGKNNYKNFVGTGVITNNNISVTQSGALGSLRASGTWIYQKGQYPNNKMNRFSFGIGGEMKVDKFSLSSSMSFNKHTSPNFGFNGYKNYDPMYSLLIWTGADYDVRDYKDYWIQKDEVQNNSYDPNINSLDNPYFQQHERTRSQDRDVFNASLTMNYELTPWLKATVRSGIDFYSDRSNIKVAKGSFSSSGEDFYWAPKLKGMYAQNRNTGWSTNNDLMFIADHRIGDFTMDGILGGSIYYTKKETMHGRTNDGLSIPGYYSLKASNKGAIVESSMFTNRVNSIYAKAGGSWKSTLYLEATLRNDWNSTLSSENRSFLYPSVAGSFIASELLPKQDWLSIWKMRGSWTVSKQAPNIYENNIVYSLKTNVWGDWSSGSLQTSVRPENLKPFKKLTTEVGTMAAFFENRLSIDFAYYAIRNEDYIKSADVSPSSGYLKSLVNTKEQITRKGFELTLGGTPIKTKDWEWNISTNWTRYADYYTKIDDDYSTKKPWVKKGERADSYIIRDFQKTSEGKIIHGEDGLPLYSNYDSVYGYMNPDWVWGVSTNVKYKSFTLSASVDGRIGGHTPSITEAYLWIAGSHPNSVIPERYADVEAAIKGDQSYKGSYISNGVKVLSGQATYDPDGNILTDNRVFGANEKPVMYKDYINRIHKNFIWGGAASPYDVYSTTFFKLRELSLTYDLPLSFCNKFSAKSGSVSFVGQNLLLWAKDFKYSDPDGGKENLSEPSQRYLGVNVKLSF